MHFIAMLAFNMPTPMSYDIGVTMLSLVVAILVTGAGFHFINRQSALPRSFVFSGGFMGLGISAMHYIGMAAMREHAEISYEVACKHQYRIGPQRANGRIPIF